MSVTYRVTITDSMDKNLDEMASNATEKKALIIKLLREAYKEFKITSLVDSRRGLIDDAEESLKNDLESLRKTLDNGLGDNNVHE